jgi:MFS transporter, PPP family, 3-phenylpropionic acid transporter
MLSWISPIDCPIRQFAMGMRQRPCLRGRDLDHGSGDAQVRLLMIPVRPPDNFILRLAFLYASLFVVIGIQFPYSPLWLQTRGLDSEAIGVVLALPIIARVIAVPLISRAIDRYGDLRAGLIVTSLAGAVGYLFVGFAHGFVAILLTVLLASFASAPSTSLSDAYALKGLTARQRPYGPARLWGSLAFIVANLAVGALLTRMAADNLIWLIVGAFLIFSAAAVMLPRSDPATQVGTDHEPQGHLWTSPRFLAIAATASLIQASHALYYGFSVVDWTAKGIGSTTIGVLWALGVVAEIALFALSGRLALNPTVLLAAGAVGAVMRWIVMAFNPPVALLPAVQCLHGLSFGATHLGAIQFVARVGGGKRAAAAQGDFATMLAIANMAATSASGLLYSALGDYGYGVMAAMAALGGACLFLARPSHA